MSDTTLRQQAELVELAPEAILVHERGSGVIRFWNRAAEELYGFGRQEALGRVSHELLQSQLPRPRAEIEAAVDRDGRWSGEVVQTTLDGRQIVVASRWAAGPKHDAAAPRTYVETDSDVTAQREVMAAESLFRGLLESAPDPVVIVDAHSLIRMVNRQTEVVFGYERSGLVGQPVEVLMPERFRARHLDHRKQAEERLKATAADLARSNAELEQFAYVASHDLQEPLRMVAGYTQLLARRYEGQLDQDADEFIGFAVDGAKRMQDLINDLLAYSRVGTRALQLESVDTGALVDQVIGDLAQAIEEAEATVTHGELPTLRADPTQLRQLFQNLHGNAIKFHG